MEELDKMPGAVLKCKQTKSIIMKNGLHMNPLLFKMVILVTCFMLVMLYNKSKGADITVKKQAVNVTVAIK